jgi:hypothetical protein
MRKLITRRLASNGLLWFLSLVIIFHIMIVAGIIPYGMVWGGRLKDDSQMFSFEFVSILVNLLMLTAVATHAGLIRWRINPTFLKVVLWLMAGVFLVNTVGNLVSENEWERIIFTPVTLLLSIFSARLTFVD